MTLGNGCIVRMLHDLYSCASYLLYLFYQCFMPRSHSLGSETKQGTAGVTNPRMSHRAAAL